MIFLLLSAATVPAAILSAQQLQAPQATGSLKEVLASGNYPPPTSSSIAARSVDFALTVSPQGDVLRCLVERPSDSPAVDNEVCRLLTGAAQFRPASDSSGKPAFGVYRGRILWALPGLEASLPPLVEAVIGLRAMPDGLSSPALVDLTVSVDGSGRIHGCAPGRSLDLAGQPIPDKVAATKILAQTACGEVTGKLTLDAVRAPDGAAAPSIQTVRVAFAADEPPASPGAKSETQADVDKQSDIVVQGRNQITRPETTVAPQPGGQPFRDLAVVGREVVLLETWGDKFYRATLRPPCFGTSPLVRALDGGSVVIEDPALRDLLPQGLLALERGTEGLFGNSEITARRPPPQEGLAFVTHADGTFDRSSLFVVRVIEDDGDMHVRSCSMISLVESDPPKNRKIFTRSNAASRPPTPIVPASPPTRAPDGGPVYRVDWQERPTEAQLEKMSRGRSGSGWILCQAGADNRVANCQAADESPAKSGIAKAIKAQADNFRIRPPIVGGRPALGAWIAIGFDFAPKRRDALMCDPANRLDPC